MSGTRLSSPRASLAWLPLLAVAATWIVPVTPDRQEDVAGARFLRPLTRAHAVQLDDERTWIVTELRREASVWTARRGGEPIRIATDRVIGDPEPRLFALGTDGLGRDSAGRLLRALRHSTVVTGGAVLLALALGVLVGVAAGLAGGRLDRLLMRGVDVVLAVPRLLALLAAVAFVPPSTPLLILLLGALTWPGLARLVRGQVLAVRDSEMLLAARAGGASSARIVLRHVLPQLGPVVAVTAALRFADTLMLESAVAFLGLGAPPPAVSLGTLLAAGQHHLVDAWWLTVFPAAAIVGCVWYVRGTVSSLFEASDAPSLV